MDHIIATCGADNIINNITVYCNLNTADHSPVSIDIGFQHVPEIETVNDIKHHYDCVGKN